MAVISQAVISHLIFFISFYVLMYYHTSTTEINISSLVPKEFFSPPIVGSLHLLVLGFEVVHAHPVQINVIVALRALEGVPVFVRWYGPLKVGRRPGDNALLLFRLRWWAFGVKVVRFGPGTSPGLVAAVICRARRTVYMTGPVPALFCLCPALLFAALFLLSLPESSL